MDSIPCTCGGLNYNCFRCDGTGMVAPRKQYNLQEKILGVEAFNDRFAPIRPTRQPKKREKRKEQTLADWAAAVAAKTQVSAAPVALPAAPKATPEVVQLASAKAASRNSPVFKLQCSVCQEEYDYRAPHSHRIHRLPPEDQRLPAEPSRSNETFARETAPSPKRDVKRQDFTATKIDRPLFQCPECPAMVKSVDKHKRKAHSSNAQTGGRSEQSNRPDTGVNLRRTGVPTVRGLPAHKVAALASSHRFHLNEREEKNLDATYRMGGTARDHGQFGSASSYDAMDDESSP